jgi:hypothetical protein
MSITRKYKHLPKCVLEDIRKLEAIIKQLQAKLEARNE